MSNFFESGPSYLTHVEWSNEEQRKSVMASLVKGVYTMEDDRNGRNGKNHLAEPWWGFFGFKLSRSILDKEGSIIGAVFEYQEWDVEYAPREVVAFRGTMLKIGNALKDLMSDLLIILHCLHWEVDRWPGLQNVIKDCTSEDKRVKRPWVAGHSLGASIAMLMAREVFKLSHGEVMLETYLFNPPFPELMYIDYHDPLLTTFRNFANVNAITSSMLFRRIGNRFFTKEEFIMWFVELRKWKPRLFVHQRDWICRGFISYFEERMFKFLERIGMAGTAAFAGTVDMPWQVRALAVHRVPSASMVVSKLKSSKPFFCVISKFVEAHALEQWWQPYLPLEYRDCSIISDREASFLLTELSRN